MSRSEYTPIFEQKYGGPAPRHDGVTVMESPPAMQHGASALPTKRRDVALALGCAAFLVLGSLVMSWVPATAPLEGTAGSSPLPAGKSAADAVAERAGLTSIILTADNGDMVGTAEGTAILSLMTAVSQREEDKDKLFCQAVTHGRIFGQKVMLVTTGIGHDRAALCLRGLLSSYHRHTKEIIFLGTGGFSPAKGGVLDSDDCSAARPATEAELVPLGSACVSPMTTNWDCHKCVWPAEVGSACAKAPCSLHDRADLFGDWGCDYYTTTSLADEVLAAARSLSIPPPSAELFALEGKYWDAMSAGTGQPYNGTLGNLTPKVLDYTECAETTSNTFWVGTPYDELARQYVADLVMAAYGSPFYARNPPGLPLPPGGLTKADVVAVSAMEGAGWMEVLALEEVFLRYDHIPAVNLRGAADYVTPPLRRRADGTWEELASFVEGLQGGDALTVLGYDLAIKTTSDLVIHLFRVRHDSGGLEVDDGGGGADDARYDDDEGHDGAAASAERGGGTRGLY